MTFKRLLLASALALPIVLSAGQAKADPISAAIVTAIGLTGTAAAVATFVINTALYAAGSWAISKVTQSGKQGLQERQAAVTSLSLGETPREMIVGTACTGGTLVDAFYFGGKYGTDTVTRGIALCDHEVDALVGYYVDDKYYAFTGSGIQPGFNGQLSIEFKNAEAGGYDPPAHVAANGGWTNNDRLCGVTHVWVDTRFDEKVWPQGHPKLKFVVRGLKCYDPRKDTAFGYTGANPHDPDDPATWEYSDNPQIQRYAYQRGIYATGRHGQAQHLLFGRGLSAMEAPPERIIAHANVCDEMVGSRRRYTSHGVISASQSHVEVEDMFAAAMAGVVVQREGGLEIEPGQAKAIVKTITDADLVTGRPVKFSEFSGDNEGGRINTVVPRYIEPSQHYKDHSGPVARVYADVIADGGPRETTLPLALVTNVDQAYDCAEITRRLARLERRATITLPPGFAELEEGDWIAWQSDRYHDGATVRYRIETWELDEGWRQTVTLREIASSVFGVPDPVEDKASPPPAPVPIDALSLSGVTAEAISLGADNGLIPAIRFKWSTSVTDRAMRAIRAEVRIAGTTEAASSQTTDIASGEMVVTNGVGPGLSLQARLIPIGSPTQPVLPTVWFTVSTAGLVAGDTVELGGYPVEDVLGRLVSVETISSTNQAAVSDLEEVFGDTVSAAESALAAGEAAALSVLKAGDSEAAASASVEAAGVATTKADEAGESAFAANANRIAAQAAKEDSEDAASASVTAAQTATAAAEDAQGYASATEGAATRAETAEGNALTYRNQASSAKDDAVAASVAAGTAASNAGLAAAYNLPRRPEQRQFFTSALTGPPESAANLVADTGVSVVDVAGEGKVLQVNGVTRHVNTLAWVPIGEGRTHRVTVRCRLLSDGVDGPTKAQVGFRRSNEAGTNNGAHYAPNRTLSVSEGWVDLVHEATSEQLKSGQPTATHIRAGGYHGSLTTSTAASGGVVQVASVTYEDVTSEKAADTHAATALTQASNASDAAAAAQINAAVAAAIGGGSMNQNPMFANWPSANPVGWVPSGSGTVTKVAGQNGSPNALQTTSTGAGNYEVYQDIDGASPGGDWVVVEADFELVSGSLQGSGVRVDAKNGGTIAKRTNLNLHAVYGAGTVGKTYRYRALVDARHVDAANFRLSGIVRWTAWSPAGAVSIRWHRLAQRKATPEEVSAGTVLPDVEAQLSITAAVAADSQSRLGSVSFDVTGGAGGNPFQIWAKAGPDGSVAGLTATALILSNILGTQVVEALKLIGGEAYFSAPVSVTISSRRLTIGPGFGVSNGLVLWFGPSSTAIASMSRTNGYFALGTDGKVYYGDAELLGGTPFKLKSSHGSVSASRSGAGTVTTPVVTFTAEGATGPVRFDVYFMSGDGSITATNLGSTDSTAPFQHQTAFTASVSIAQIKTGTFICSARDAAGNSDTALVNVGLHENT